MKSLISEFRSFILRGNVIDLAVAVVIGAAFTGVINSFVNDILGGVLGAIGGKPDFSSLVLTIGDGQIRYGAFLTAVINLLIIGLAVFFMIVKPVNSLIAMRKTDEVAEDDPADVALLKEIRDLLKAQQN